MPNCKEGDLAVVVFSNTCPELVGRYVIVEHLWREGEKSEDGHKIKQTRPGSLTWWVRSAVAGQKLPVRSTKGKFRHLFRRPCWDEMLRPIRDNDGEDEMLRVVGKPKSKSKPKAEA
jgi:hypothetical protein